LTVYLDVPGERAELCHVDFARPYSNFGPKGPKDLSSASGKLAAPPRGIHCQSPENASFYMRAANPGLQAGFEPAAGELR
jgi:hypothetical protein